MGTSADVRTESRGVALVCGAAEAMDTGRRGVQEDFRDRMTNVEDGGGESQENIQQTGAGVATP